MVRDRGDLAPLQERGLGDWSAAWEGQARPGQAAGWGGLRDQACDLSRETKRPIPTAWGFGENSAEQDARCSRWNINDDVELENIVHVEV